MNLDASALSAIPYLDTTDLSGRFVTTTLFCVAGKWRMWMPVESRLIEIQAWPAESVYFSDSPQSADDITLHFLDFMAQRANISTVQKPTLGLHDDLFNLAASLAEIDHLHHARKSVGSGVSRMIVTEVEFLFSICRSIFDLLQEIIVALWSSIQLHDSTVVKKPLRELILKHGPV